jgi:uncharacterized protein YggE
LPGEHRARARLQRLGCALASYLRVDHECGPRNWAVFLREDSAILFDDAAGLIDAAAEAGANQVSGPGLSSSNAEALYRQALAKAVAEARARAEALAKAAGRSVGEITAIVEGGAATPLPYAERAALDSAQSTPIVPGQQETTATISVTFSLH